MNERCAPRLDRSRRLMVIVPDRLSTLIAKGEVTPRYYNPGTLFDEVHIVMTNDDRPDPAAIQSMVGEARLVLHNLDPGPHFFHRTLGWQPTLMKRELRAAVALARRIAPALVRTHNNFLEGYLAVEIKRRLGIPFVTSLHGVWDRDLTQPNLAKERIIRLFRRKLEKRTLREAAAVIAVYRPIVRYADAIGSRNTQLVYNAVSSTITRKPDYRLNRPPRLLTVNRQVPEKNPENVIRAIADIECSYTLIGDGPYHERLKTVAREVGVADRVTFIRGLPNSEVCALLPQSDIWVAHCDYWGISKGTIEAALAGLPIVLNHHPVEPIPDLDGDWVQLCDNSVEGYRAAIAGLLGDDAARCTLGSRAYAHAKAHFDPMAMEGRLCDIYRAAMKETLR